MSIVRARRRAWRSPLAQSVAFSLGAERGVLARHTFGGEYSFYLLSCFSFFSQGLCVTTEGIVHQMTRC